MPKKKQAQVDYSNHPYVSNYPDLAAWLEKHDAHCAWQVPSSPAPEDYDPAWYPSSYVEGWRVRGGLIVIIMIYSNKCGWDLFTALDSNKVDATLADAEERLGLNKEVK